MARICPWKQPRSEEGENSEEEPLSSDKEDDIIFTLTEADGAFMEVAFKSKLNMASKKKKIKKLGMPNCKWTKSLELDSFIASTIPKKVVWNNNAAQKTQRLWLKALSVLAAIMDISDMGKISDGKIIQGIRNALLLLGMHPNNIPSNVGRLSFNT